MKLLTSSDRLRFTSVVTSDEWSWMMVGGVVGGTENNGDAKILVFAITRFPQGKDFQPFISSRLSAADEELTLFS